MTLPQLEDRTLLADRVFDLLHASITNGELAAGHRLRIRDIAAQVGTSVMPVREAIRRLEEAGLAERVPHKGAVVSGLGLDELVHVYGVRTLLEVEAARLGATAIGPAGIRRMERAYERMCTAIGTRDAVAVLDHDEALLTHLYEAAGNPVLTDTVRTLWQRCRPYKVVGAVATLASDDTAPLRTYQAELLDAVRANDGTGAARVTRASLRNATQRIRAELAGQAPAS